VLLKSEENEAGLCRHNQWRKLNDDNPKSGKFFDMAMAYCEFITRKKVEVDNDFCVTLNPFRIACLLQCSLSKYAFSGLKWDDLRFIEYLKEKVIDVIEFLTHLSHHIATTYPSMLQVSMSTRLNKAASLNTTV
jgi:hypothetical protein